MDLLASAVPPTRKSSISIAQAVLTTSIIGLSVETSRSPRDLEAERMGLLDSFSQGGITCSVIHYEDHKADSKSKAVISILVQLPNLLGNGRAIVVHKAARQELGLEIKEAVYVGITFRKLKIASMSTSRRRRIGARPFTTASPESQKTKSRS